MKNTINILLVDDQPSKLLSYEVMLSELGENLIKASSGREALGCLLKTEIAVVLIDVCMPDLDGFELAAMIRQHPRFERTAIIFVSAIHLADIDRIRGYELGGVDYVPVPIVPEVLRAKVRIFVELFRKNQQLEQLNKELEQRVEERTAELKASTARLLQSERMRSLALIAGQMGSWEWDLITGHIGWDEGQYRICGVDPAGFTVNAQTVRALLHPEDLEKLKQAIARASDGEHEFQVEFRVCRPSGEIRRCIGSIVTIFDSDGQLIHMTGVTVDVTQRKEAEERQTLLSLEIDHRARNVLSVVQSIVRLTREKTIKNYVAAVEGRISALARVHTLLSTSRWEGAEVRRLVIDELAPYQDPERITVKGSDVSLNPSQAQAMALVIHELATNAVKYGAISKLSGQLRIEWEVTLDSFILRWFETCEGFIKPPSRNGYGTTIIAATIERQLGGRAIFDWHPQGLHCTLKIPHSVQSELREYSTLETRKVLDSTKSLKGNRVLLVEDEALVAMMMKDMLEEFGLFVVGPYSGLNDALAAAEKEIFDAAILDINLKGELSYPVADTLTDRGIPLIFITGYGDKNIISKFSEVPALQKPIAQLALESILNKIFSTNAPFGRSVQPIKAGQNVMRRTATSFLR